MTTKLRVTWVRSTIKCPGKQKRTIQALGLRHLNQTVEHYDSPVMRGMIFHVKHLVRVEEVNEE